MKSKIYKNFDLKKFIKLLQPQDFDNQKQIYLDFLQSCSTKKESASQIEERWSKSGFDNLLYSMMETGKFFPYVSDNFKLEEKTPEISIKLTSPTFFNCRIVCSYFLD